MERRKIMSGIIGVSNNISTPVVIAPTKPEATTAPAPAKTETPPNPPYVVDLTGTALAKSMKLQGQTPEQISVAMGVDIKTVDSYLNVQPSEPTLMLSPAQSPATQPDLTPSTSASSTTTSPTIPAPTKLSPPTPDLIPNLSPDQTPGSSTTQGTSGIPAVPAALAPPASFSPQSNVNSAPSAMKALGI
jgi:hypothetical protein